MKANENSGVHLGENIKCLMRAFNMPQYRLAQKAGLTDNQLSGLLHKAEIDDDTLQRVAEGLGNGVTPEIIRAYRHEDTISFIINNYTQNVENGGSGTQIPNQENIQHVEEGGSGRLNQHDNSSNTTFQEGSTQNNYVAEQAFALAEKNTELEKLLLYYRMQTEPDAVKEEIESLKKKRNQDGE